MVDTRQVDAAAFEVLVGGDFAPKVSAAVFEILAGGVYTPLISGAGIEVLVGSQQILDGAGAATVSLSASATGQRTARGAGSATISLSTSATGLLTVVSTTVHRLGDRRRKIRRF